MTLRSSDLQSDSDLDSIRNSCDVFLQTMETKPTSNFLVNISKRLNQGEVYCQRCHGQKFPSDGGKIWSDPSLIVATDGKGCPR